MKKILLLLCLLTAVCVSAQTTMVPVPYLKKNGKYIYVDKDMKPLIKTEFDEARPFNGGLAVVKTGGFYGYIDVKGSFLVPANLETAEDLCEDVGVFRSASTKKYGIIDKTGKTILSPDYDYIYNASNGMLLIKKNGLLGYANTKGVVVIPCKYSDEYGKGARDFSCNRAVVKVNGFYGCINRKGELLVENKYNHIGPFSDGVACAKLDNIYGYIDTLGYPVVPFVYAYGTDFCSGVAVVKKGDKKYVIDRNNKTIISDVNAGNFREGIAIFNNYGKPGVSKTLWGYIDKTGKIIVDLKYEEASEFRDGMAKVKENGKYGYIDKTGKMIIAAKYADGYYFKNGYAEVKETSDGKRFYIDKTGREFREK